MTQLGEWIEGKYYVEGLEYTFPKRPPLNQIRNSDLPKSKQIWKRRLDDEEFDWSEGWEERLNDNPEQLQFIFDEVNRITNGEWVMINGEPTYLNGDTYFFLQHFVLEDTGEYPEYRDTALYYYRFRELTRNSRFCTGDTLLKGRRLGATSMVMSALLRRSITVQNKNFGIISKTGADAEGAFGILVNAFQSLKPYLKPQVEGNDAPKKVLSMKKQSSRIKKDQKVTGAREGLNNKVLWRPTALNTFDSGAYEDILVDESGKFPKDVPISKYIQIVTKCVKKGAKITGKLSLPTTVNPPKEGGDEYKHIWEKSNQLDANYLGETKTGLYRIMIPAYFGFAGYIDQYGNSVVENPTPEQTKYLAETGECPDPNIGAKKYLENKRKELENDLEALAEEKRMNPFTPKEVFEAAEKKTYFNKPKHNAQLDLIREKLVLDGKDPDKDEYGRRGWFRERADGTVMFEDDPKGLWYIIGFPDVTNKFEKRLGSKGYKYKPKNLSFGGAGLDPIAHASATVEKGSDACLIIRSRVNILRPYESGRPEAMFLGRMDVKSEFHKQIFWGLKFYGVRVLGERAPSDWSDWAVENGYEEYLIGTQRVDKTWVYGANAQNKDYLEQHLTVMVESSYDDVDKVFFKRLIKDRLDYDIKARTDYDACIADGNALIACSEPVVVQQEYTGIKFIKQGKISTY